MQFIYLPEQHHLTPDSLFCKNDPSSIGLVPYGHLPVWYEYNFDSGSWTNPRTGKCYTTNPFDLTERDSSFVEGFYELTKIEGLTFHEGEAWSPYEYDKIYVEKTVPSLLWNSFFRRYDPPCDRYSHLCVQHKIKYEFEKNTIHEFVNIEELLKCYCECSLCEFCSGIHTFMHHCSQECRK
jgi:hypothetical protein